MSINQNKSWYFLSLVIFSFALRYIYLDRIPSGINGDEVIYPTNAKIIALSGSDITQTWNPLSALVFQTPGKELQAELPYFLHLPFSGLLPLNLLIARLPMALLSVGIIILIYLISSILFDYPTALTAALIASINPFLLHFGRTAYDITPAIFFFLLTLYIFLKAQGKSLYWTVPVQLLSFYSYIGTKILVFPFTLILAGYRFLTSKTKKQLTYLLAPVISGFSISIFYALVITFFSTSDRLTEIGTGSSGLTSYLQGMINRASKAISLEYLFVSGDLFFSSFKSGLFLIPDFFLIVFGILKMQGKFKKQLGLLAAMTGISLLPQILHTPSTDNFAPHIGLAVPFLIIIAAFGARNLFFPVKTILGKTAAAAVIFIYIFFISQWLHYYFFQFPVTSQFDLKTRVVSRYLALTEQAGGKTVVKARSAADFFRKDLFYRDQINESTLPEITLAQKSRHYLIGNASIYDCGDITASGSGTAVVITDSECQNPTTPANTLTVRRLTDGGVNFYISGDNICQNYELKPYPSALTFSDLALEKLSTGDFCRTFISQYPAPVPEQ
jgi:4-amino-4-deoxy-L-arabinose transferase-like glycosyltransferase